MGGGGWGGGRMGGGGGWKGIEGARFESGLFLFCFVLFFPFFSPRLFSGFALISIGQRALVAAPGGGYFPS